MSQLEYVLSEKGKKMLLLDSHLFYMDHPTGDTIYWRCKSSKKTKCKSRVTTVLEVVKNAPIEHNHDADAADVEAAKHMARLRVLAATTRDPPYRVVAEVSESCGLAAAYRMGKASSLTRTVRSVRQKLELAPALPAELKKLNAGAKESPAGGESGNLRN